MPSVTSVKNRLTIQTWKYSRAEPVNSGRTTRPVASAGAAPDRPAATSALLAAETEVGKQEIHPGTALPLLRDPPGHAHFAEMLPAGKVALQLRCRPLVSLLRRGAPVLDRPLAVLRDALPVPEHVREIGLRVRDAAVGRALVPLRRGALILGASEALVEQPPHA